MAGIEYMWRESLDCPVDLFFTAPSCVPASSFETPFEELDAGAVCEMFTRGWCDSLGEVMNYPGVISGDPSLWAKLYASGDRARSGHAPGLTGKGLVRLSPERLRLRPRVFRQRRGSTSCEEACGS